MLFLLSLISLLFAQTSQDEIVITAPRMAKDRTIKVITQKDLSRLQNTTVADVLKAEAGIDVARTGLGGQGSVFIRGGESGHTLILVDGIEANDPSDPTRRFNLTLINVKDVERIEIIKGARSVAYGSDALAGVINIVTKWNLEPAEKRFYFNQELGSFKTSRTEVKAGHRPFEHTQFQLKGFHEETQGYSVAKYANGDDDYFYRDGVGALVKTELAHHTFEGHYDFSKIRQEFDGGANLDDPNAQMKTGTHRALLAYHGEIGEKTLMPSLRLSETRYKRDSHDPIDAINTFGSSTITIGDAKKADLDFKLVEIVGNTFSFGGELDDENMKIDSANQSEVMLTQYMHGSAIFLSDEFVLDDLKLNAGVRNDHSNLVRNATTYRFSASYNLNNELQLLSSYGTGFKSPTMYQFFAPTYGNSGLKPEESESFDGGVFYKTKKLEWASSYFQNDFEKLIVFNSVTSKYQNLDLAHVHGVENSFKVKPTSALDFGATYTWMRTRDRMTGKELPARAKQKATFLGSYNFEKWTPALEVLMMGRRRNSSSNDLTNAGYVLFNTNLTYQLKDTMNLNFRIDNILDKEYVEFIGFNTLKRSYLLGFQWLFD